MIDSSQEGKPKKVITKGGLTREEYYLRYPDDDDDIGWTEMSEDSDSEEGIDPGENENEQAQSGETRKMAKKRKHNVSNVESLSNKKPMTQILGVNTITPWNEETLSAKGLENVKSEYLRMRNSNIQINRNANIDPRVKFQIGLKCVAKGKLEISNLTGWEDWDDEQFFTFLTSTLGQIVQPNLHDMLKKVKLEFRLNLKKVTQFSSEVFSIMVQAGIDPLDPDSVKGINSKPIIDHFMDSFKKSPDKATRRLGEVLKTENPTVDQSTLVEFLALVETLAIKGKHERQLGDMWGDYDNPDVEKDSNSDSKKGKVDCRGCGKTHRIPCKLHGHPDYNRSHLPWKQSRQGISYASLGMSQLPYNQKLSDDKKSLVQYEQVDYLKFLIETDIDNDPIYAILRKEVKDTGQWADSIRTGLRNKFSVCLDSGAKFDYINQQLVKDLSMSNPSKDNEKHKSRITCGVFGQCKELIPLAKVVNLQLRQKEVIYDLDLTPIVGEDLPVDIIVGRQTMRKHNLTDVFYDHFHNTPRPCSGHDAGDNSCCMKRGTPPMQNRQLIPDQLSLLVDRSRANEDTKFETRNTKH